MKASVEPGHETAGPLCKAFIAALKASSLGSQADTKPTVKFYVGPYKGSINGAMPADGIKTDLGTDDRHKASPKAILSTF
jgi:hypothetical protein